MGDFFGHSLPGSFFTLVGLWWLVNIYSRYFRSQCDDDSAATPYVSRLTFPVRALGRCAHIDAILLVLMCSVGIIVELILCPIFRTHGHIPMELVQHATMYFFFGLFAMTALLTSRVTSRLGYQCQDLQYVTLAMALTVEGLLFKNHLFGRDEIDTMLHELLIYAIGGGVVCTWLEMAYRSNVLAAMGRVFFTLLQGTWFWQVSFWLYNPFTKSKHDDVNETMTYHDLKPQASHDTKMLMACAFVWHMGAITLLMMMTGACMAWRFKKQGRGPRVLVERPIMAPGLGKPSANGESHGLLEMELSDTEL